MEKKFTQRVKTIQIEPYGYHLHVSVSNDVSEAFKKSRVRKLVPKDGEPDGAAFVWRRGGCTDVFMFLPDGASINVLTHESYHVTYFVLRDSGVKCSDDAEEAWSYLQAYITEHVAKFVYKKLAVDIAPAVGVE